jgi:hypothetical protein
VAAGWVPVMMLRIVTGAEESDAFAVDRFVDRVTRANGAMSAISGTIP